MHSMSVVFDGKLYDGNSAKAQGARVRMLGRFVEVESDLSREQIAVELLRRDNHAASVTLHRTDSPDWRLTLRSEAAPELAPIQKLHAMTSKHWGMIGGSVAAVAAFGALIWFGGNLAVSAAAPMIPPSITKPIGEQYSAMFMSEDGECKAAPGRAALDKMIARVTPKDGFVMPVTVRVSKSETVNAITLPGGEIIVFNGLIAASESPEELAGVIAHEFGHVQHYHSNEALIRQFGFSVFLEGIGGNMGSLAATGLMLRNSRDAEVEADGEAISLMKQGAVSPLGLSAFFDRMNGGTGKVDPEQADAARPTTDENAIDSIFATHPGDSSRRSRFAKAAKGYAAKPILTDAEWQSLKTMCGKAKE
jgi:beta-barrel assembly-enhancing protease